MSTGKRLTRPSDDPVAIGAIINARSDLTRVLNRQKVLQRAERMTGPADAALDGISSALRQVKDLVLTATQPGLTDAARSSQAAIVRSYRERILDEANVCVGGEYLFAGRLSRSAPFIEGAGGVEYTGDSGAAKVYVAPERPLEITIPGDRLFNYENELGERSVAGVERDLFTLLDDIASSIQSGDEAAIPGLADELDALHTHVVEERGVLGARVQRIQDSAGAARDAEVFARELLSDTEDVDIATTLIDLQYQQLCYQAALAATSTLARIPTLFELGWQ